mmetsp:Transcript_21374/g.24838  ORF Transcript_21374/g.24838 Transcript_21374/m.24838 type:complete len:483 (+) Transcript_21374:30-1478(+)|eukprot:CAMPEP_0176446854 /NCGR_PEP_ID=MMETSP0127-20121128/24605_1 /TAXON_ID=938130 /ORGANISM="Platyophrya macrostoma, Strain WH" /LENGTH=482 /DNA_ID=CAMNT_0017833031 /DNA_START=30 /DNA_END=1478 /DNA_ORIENTATION=+
MVEAKGLSSDQINFIKKYTEEQFDKSILPALQDYIRIPNLSRNYDPEWSTNGKLEECAEFLLEWAKKQNLKGSKAEIIKEKGRTPLIFIEVDGTSKDAETVLLYGHFDKQPWMTGWREGLGPITPVIEGDKLFGRGGADDGYALFGCVHAIKTLQEQGIPHPRCVIFIEGDEESGSIDLAFYFDLLSQRIGTPKLLFCLDSGCGDYERLYITNTLRGVYLATLNIKILNEGVHSGDASGVVADTFRILRILLDRLEDSKTGVVHRGFHVNIPGDRYKQAEDIAKIIGKDIQEKFPWVGGAKPVDEDPLVTYLNRIWRPQLAYVGVDGLPATSKAGNVLRPETNVRLSLRLPPTLSTKKAEALLKEILEKDPPYGAQVTLTGMGGGQGWNAPYNQKYLDDIVQSASMNFYGKESVYYGEGGSIPFIGMLNEKYPDAQFIVSGILGPFSNAHGPNESLDIPYTKKFLGCITQILAEVTPHFIKQ